MTGTIEPGDCRTKVRAVLKLEASPYQGQPVVLAHPTSSSVPFMIQLTGPTGVCR